LNQEPKYKEGNLSFGEYKFLYINEEMNFVAAQKFIVSTFFNFTENLIKPYSLDLCFEQFDPETQLPLTKKDYQAFMLKIENSNVCFLPIWTKTQEIEVRKVDEETVMEFIIEKNNKNKQNDFFMGLSHLSFQAGLFRLPQRVEAKKFFLEKENQISYAFEYPCISEEWFEAPLEKTFMFPPIELNFSREPYSRAWSLSINLNWDIYSEKNEKGFGLLSEKIKLMENNGWTKKF
jgi:hypothetical protein